eukprot:jgi/Chlat1/3655/Chrsp238S03642
MALRLLSGSLAGPACWTDVESLLHRRSSRRQTPKRSQLGLWAERGAVHALRNTGASCQLTASRSAARGAARRELQLNTISLALLPAVAAKLEDVHKRAEAGVSIPRAEVTPLCAELVKAGRPGEALALCVHTKVRASKCIDKQPFLAACAATNDVPAALEYLAACSNEYAYSGAIAEFGKRGRLAGAQAIFKAVQECCVPPPAPCYVNLIHASVQVGDTFAAGSLVDNMIEAGMEPASKVINWVVAATLPKAGVRAVLADVARWGVKPDPITCSLLLKACSESRNLVLAEEVVSLMREQDVPMDTVSYNVLVQVAVRAGEFERAWQIVVDMREAQVSRDAYTYGELLGACAQEGQVDRAIGLLDEMKADNVLPNIFIYNRLIALYSRSGQQERALRLIDKMQEDDVMPDVATLNSLLPACGTFQEAYDLMRRWEADRGIKPDVWTYTEMIDLAGTKDAQDVSRAWELFDDMKSKGIAPDVVFYTALIKLCESAGRHGEAMRAFLSMRKDGLRPNAVTSNTVIRACVRHGDLQYAFKVYEDMRDAGLAPNTATFESLIDAWAEHAFHPLRADEQAVGRTSVMAGLLFGNQLRLKEEKGEHGHLLIDLHGLNAAEARAAVLSLLKLVRSRHREGDVVRDLVIITGQGHKSRVPGNAVVRSAVTDLLEKELALSVLSTPTVTPKRIQVDTRNRPTPLHANIGRLVVVKDALRNWLLKPSRTLDVHEHGESEQ